jgi:hypothetical protein
MGTIFHKNRNHPITDHPMVVMEADITIIVTVAAVKAGRVKH